MDGFGSRKVEKLLAAIQDAKTREFHRVLYSLGIPRIGRSVSKELVASFGNLERLLAAPVEQIADKVGPAAARSFDQWRNNASDVAALLAAKLKTGEEGAQIMGTGMTGMTVVITGTLSQPRSFFEDLIESMGGKCSGSVSRKTSFILAGEEAGSKLNKARETGIPVLNEEEFRSRYLANQPSSAQGGGQ